MVNRSIEQIKKEGRCTKCIMNTICTFNQKEQKGKSGHCPSSVKNLPPADKESMPEMKVQAKIEFIKHQPGDIIPVIKMVYWDGSKFIIRADKKGYKRILCKLRVKMRSRFLALSIEEQIEIGHSQTMLKRTEENMSEEDYLKIAPYEDLIRE